VSLALVSQWIISEVKKHATPIFGYLYMTATKRRGLANKTARFWLKSNSLLIELETVLQEK